MNHDETAPGRPALAPRALAHTPPTTANTEDVHALAAAIFNAEDAVAALAVSLAAANAGALAAHATHVATAPTRALTAHP